VDLDSQERKESRAQNFTAAPFYRFDGEKVILHDYMVSLLFGSEDMRMCGFAVSILSLRRFWKDILR
jgi:hypothetical protein